jgi:multiple sugar transport system permease protein
VGTPAVQVSSPTLAKASRPQKLGTLARERIFWGYVMIAPMLIGLLVFYVWPLIQTVYFSFTNWGAFGSYTWTGLDNYSKLLSDPNVSQALKNTFIYTFVTVPCTMVLSIIVATLLNQNIRGKAIYRTLYFLPVVTMPAAIGMIWKWLYEGDYGLINQALKPLGIQGPHWITDTRTAMLALIIVGVWSSIGYNMVLFLAGLQAIPISYYEAATIDGAGPLAKFFRITIPLLSPTIFFALVIAFINAFQIFDVIFIMFGPSNPAFNNVQSVVYLFYNDAFVTNDKGVAAAIAVVLLAIILAFTAVQLWLQRRWVHYA